MNRLISRIFIAAVLTFLPLSFADSETRGEELLIVEDGESLAPVVIFEDAPPKTRRAADELAEYIEKTSGVRPEVLEGEPDPIPEKAIWVGYQPVMENLFPDTNLGFEHPEEILIAANADHLVIAGRDKWNPEHLVVEMSGSEIDGVQMEYGTVNAVYTFLQDYLGVRWFWPGELGIDVVEQDTIAFSPFEYRHHPTIRVRDTILRLSQPGDHRGYSHEWTRLQRLQLDSLQMHTGSHAFSGWWARFHETHPEYFALQPDGSRGGGDQPFPTARTVKICKSNPDVWEQWFRDVEEIIQTDPNRTVFRAGANDSGASGYCICENCRAWDHPEGTAVRFRWEGIAQPYVAMSDRQVTFANTLGRKLKERYPEKDYYVRIAAYGNSRPVPVEAVPDDNVVIASVSNFHNRPGMEDAKERLLGWAEIAPNILWRPNLGGAAGWRDGLLNVAPYAAIEDIQLVAGNNVLGIAMDTIWEYWATQGPHYYMLAQMAWNPHADGEAILDDYYRRCFGKAADEMKAYWDMLQDAAHQIVYLEESRSDVWDESFFEEAASHLDSAVEMLHNEELLYHDRIGFVRTGLDFTRLLLDTQEQIARLRESYGEDEEAEAKARENWGELLRLSEQYPNAMNWRNIHRGEGGWGRFARLHPDHYDN